MSNKRKIYIFLSATLFLIIGLFTFLYNRVYIVKNEKIIASVISFIDDSNIDDIIYYLKSNDINTAIIDSNNLKSKYIKRLSREKIQTFVHIYNYDNAEELIKKYRPAAIVVNSDINMPIRCPVFLEIDDIASYKDGFDGYIIKNTDYKELLGFENYNEKLVLLHYNSENFWDDVFYLSNFSRLDGAVVSEYGIGSKLIPTGVVYKNDNLLNFDFKVSNDFCVTYPTQDITTYYSGIFVTGTGEKSGVVAINDVLYNSQSDGTFGIYIPLEKGKNNITVSQNGIEYNFVVTKKEYKTTSSAFEPEWDDTEKLEKGSVVKTVSDNLTSILYSPDDDSKISAGFSSDIPLVVYDCAETVRNGKKTWAYQLQNGMYVLASKVENTGYISEIYDGDTNDKDYLQPVNIDNISLEKSGRDDILTFKTTGKTGVFTNLKDNILNLTFLNTILSQNINFNSKFIKNVNSTVDDSGVHIILELSDENKLWGYDVKIDDNKVTLYLKSAPEISGGKKLLSGVTVMIDAGHGGYDSGAMGVATNNGPVEKDLNLATAQALKTLLTENGATVVMTRDDDTFLSLEERRSKIEVIKPDIFVAVHHNSMDYSYNSENAKGCEAYYFTDISKNLAEVMCSEVSISTDRYNRGAENGYYYVTRTNICPAILMEYSFIINADEYSKTYTDEYIYKSAFGSFKAILKILENKNEI